MDLESLKANLKLTNAEMEMYLPSGKTTLEQVRILKALRQQLSDSVHKNQKLLDKVDFVLFELKSKGRK